VKSDWRIVIDTNVFVSAVLLPRSVPRQALDRARSAGILLVSEATVTELDDVLRREKFDRYISNSQRLEFLLAVLREAETVAAVDASVQCRDPKDSKFLELALSGRASHIITGDSDLLELGPFCRIEILTPRSFLGIPAP
jgi:putative PIN family toxin of toxin-antitoxin system